MIFQDSHSSYGWVSICTHWIIALAFIGLFALGFWMVDLGYYSEWYRAAPHYHKSVGLILFALIVIKLIWRAFQPKPQSLNSHKSWERQSAKIAHKTLYVLLIVLMFSGYFISTADGRAIDVFDWFAVPGAGEFINNQEDIAGAIHKWLAYFLAALVTAHAGAALKHHFVDKDNTLIRMLKTGDNS